jgi:predicted ABC-type ATPase
MNTRIDLAGSTHAVIVLDAGDRTVLRIQTNVLRGDHQIEALEVTLDPRELRALAAVLRAHDRGGVEKAPF